MASSFQNHFNAIYLGDDIDPEENLLDRERRILGVDHTELGAIYLSQHQLPPVLVEVARHHHHPERSQKARELSAAVHIADMLARYAHIGMSGNKSPVEDESWLNSKAWRILYPNTSQTDQQIAQASLKRTLERLPHVLEGLV
jgi:HD-like signal output (HDOD) protein